MGHKKKKTHSKNYNKNSNKINITIHNEKAKTKRKRSTNKPKSGISSQLGQHAQTNTVLYNAKEDQSDLVNQASNYTNHVKKQYNALLENVAEEARPTNTSSTASREFFTINNEWYCSERWY